MIKRIWPDEDPFKNNSRRAILKAVKSYLGTDAQDYNLSAGSDARAMFQYHLHKLPDGATNTIGTSSLLAAWNAATYVAQIEDHIKRRPGDQ